jgi:hypothetical protein
MRPHTHTSKKTTGYRAAPRSAALRRAAVHTTTLRSIVHSPALLARHQRRCHRLRAAERGDDAATTAVVDEQQKEQQQAAEDSSGADAVAATAQHEAQKTAAAEGSSSNNTSSSSSSSSYKWDPDTWRPDAAALPAEPAFEPLAGGALAWARLKMALALPWRRVKKGSALTFKLEGDVSDALKGRFAPGVSLPQVVSALEKAALDPRISGIAVEIGPLSCGYARIEELRRAIARFRESGKYTIAWMKIATEREYYLATAFGEVYAAPTASLRLNGFTVGGASVFFVECVCVCFFVCACKSKHLAEYCFLTHPPPQPNQTKPNQINKHANNQTKARSCAACSTRPASSRRCSASAATRAPATSCCAARWRPSSASSWGRF